MKIGLCGTVSVGKTTLIKSLAKLPQFKDYKIATERSQYLQSLGIPLNKDSTTKGQAIFLAERVSELMVDNLLTDRTIIDVMAFTRLSKTMTSEQKLLFEKYAAQFLINYDYIFYVSPAGVEIENNGIRETNAEYRWAIDLEIKNILDLYQIKIQNLSSLIGSNEKRTEKILKSISL